MWVQIALLTAQMFLGEILRPRPKRISFEDFKKDNAPSEIRPIPYVAGTVQLIPSRIWYGDFSQRAVERDSQWTDYLFFGLLGALLDFITVAYRYYCGECFAICFGPDAHIEQIQIGERLMYQAALGTDNAGGGFLIDDPQAWGGDQPPGEGGQYSWCDITRGNYIDATNPYLESMLSTPPNKTPSGHGVTLLISRGRSGYTESGYFAAGGVGFIPRFREWKVTVRRQPNNLATAYSKIGRHANPMEVIYEWCTSIEYGARVPASELNLASFRTAAQDLHGENLGWSGKIEDTTTPFEIVQNVAAQVDAVIDPSPSLGLTVRLIRRNYSIPSLPILDRSVITDVDGYSPGTYEDTVNKIIVPFNDQNNNNQPRPGIYIDPANQMIQGGRIVPQTQNYRGVGDYDTANMLATRDGRALAIPRPPLVCSVIPSFGKLRYRGEVVLFEWSSPSFSKVMRITGVELGTAQDPDYKLEMIEDQFATGARTAGSPSGTGHTDIGIALDTAPPSASWDSSVFPPDGLQLTIGTILGGTLSEYITGAIIFGSYAPGGQYARIWVTEPGAVQSLSPIYLAPDMNNLAQFQWPALVRGDYTFCIQTFSLHGATNGVKVCATIAVASPSISPSASTSPSESPSVSPSASDSPSPSASVSPSGSVSPSMSNSPSPSPSVSPSSSVSPSASLSPSASVSPSASDSPSSAPSSITWTGITGATESPAGLLTKTASNGWGNMGAISVETMSGNCRLSYYWTDAGVDLDVQQRIFGFGLDASCNTYSTIDYAMHMYVETGINKTLCYQNGSTLGLPFGINGASDGVLLQIERIGTEVKFYYHEWTGTPPLPGDAGRTLFQTSGISSTGSLAINVATDVNGHTIDAADMVWEAI